MSPFLTVAYFLGIWTMATAYPNGAPSTVCDSMTPNHYGSSQQMSASPFSVRVSKTTYSPGELLTITLAGSAGNMFKGFLLVAKTTGGNSNNVGQLNVISGSKKIDLCAGVTHTVDNDKSSMVFQWTAPQAGVGNVIFYATFVKNKETFWVKVPSAEIKFSPATSPTPGTQSPVPTTVRKATARTATTTRTPATPRSPLRRIPLNSSCGIDISCFVGCIWDDCFTQITWEVRRETKEILFHMQSIVPDNDNQWMAVGFSRDDNMGDDSVVDCSASGGQFKAHSSWNSPYKANMMENSVPGTVTLQSASLDGNLFSCSVRRKLNTTGNGMPFDITRKSTWYLLFAQGKTDDMGVKKKHSFRSWDSPFASTLSLDLDRAQLYGWIAMTAGGMTNTIGPVTVLVSIVLAFLIF